MSLYIGRWTCDSVTNMANSTVSWGCPSCHLFAFSKAGPMSLYIGRWTCDSVTNMHTAGERFQIRILIHNRLRRKRTRVRKMTRIKGEMNHQRQLTSVLPIVPITPSLGLVPAAICSHSARLVQCRFTLADGHAIRLLTCTLLVNASKSES
jgi:hypothetical protein